MAARVLRLGSQAEQHEHNRCPEDHVEHNSDHDIACSILAFHLISSLINERSILGSNSQQVCQSADAGPGKQPEG